MTEPEIIIDGKKLTVGEAMTVRVAINSFVSDIQENGLGEDEHGKAMSEGYIRNGNAVLMKMDCYNI